MTAIEDAIFALLDVDASNYTNYGAKPTLKIIDEDWSWFMAPRDIGVKIIAGDSGDAAQDHQGTLLFSTQKCSVEGREAKNTTCTNLRDDVKNLITAAGYTITSYVEPKPESDNKFVFKMAFEKIQGA